MKRSAPSTSTACAAKIRNPTSLSDKLGVKAGQKISISRKLEKKFIDVLHDCGASVGKRSCRDSDIIFLRSNAAKNSTGWPVSRRLLHPTLVDVKVAGFSDTHTAEKLVIPVRHRDMRRDRG